MNVNIIKIEMIKNNINNIELAKIIGVNNNTISRWLNNKNLNQIESFLKLCIHLDIDIKKLMS